MDAKDGLSIDELAGVVEKQHENNVIVRLTTIVSAYVVYFARNDDSAPVLLYSVDDLLRVRRPCPVVAVAIVRFVGEISGFEIDSALMVVFILRGRAHAADKEIWIKLDDGIR